MRKNNFCDSEQVKKKINSSMNMLIIREVYMKNKIFYTKCKQYIWFVNNK